MFADLLELGIVNAQTGGTFSRTGNINCTSTVVSETIQFQKYLFDNLHLCWFLYVNNIISSKSIKVFLSPFHLFVPLCFSSDG